MNYIKDKVFLEAHIKVTQRPLTIENIKTRRTQTSDRYNNISTTKTRNLAHRGQKGTTDMNNHADMCCVGQNFTVYAFTGNKCTICPCINYFKPVKNVKFFLAATAVDDIIRQIIICNVNQALYFGDSLNNLLLDPHQIRSFGLEVNDNPYDQDKFFGIIDYESNVEIPFITGQRP